MIGLHVVSFALLASAFFAAIASVRKQAVSTPAAGLLSRMHGRWFEGSLSLVLAGVCLWITLPSGVVRAIEFDPFPGQEVKFPEGSKFDARRAALGMRLFGEVALSEGGNRSCASCHDSATSWTSRQAVYTSREILSLWNVGYFESLFWDGQRDNLIELTHGSWGGLTTLGARDKVQISKNLGDVPSYENQFLEAYGERPTPTNVVDAISMYVRTITSANSTWAQYISDPEKNATLLDDHELEGWTVFSTLGCVDCHDAPFLTDRKFYNLATVSDSPDDIGRFKYSPDGCSASEIVESSDESSSPCKHAFRTPSLIDVANTAPYFHDGGAKTLSDVIHRKVPGIEEQHKLALLAFLNVLSVDRDSHRSIDIKGK